MGRTLLKQMIMTDQPMLTDKVETLVAQARQELKQELKKKRQQLKRGTTRDGIAGAMFSFGEWAELVTVFWFSGWFSDAIWWNLSWSNAIWSEIDVGYELILSTRQNMYMYIVYYIVYTYIIQL